MSFHGDIQHVGGTQFPKEQVMMRADCAALVPGACSLSRFLFLFLRLKT